MTALVPVHDIVWREKPFAGAVMRAQVRYGATVAEMMLAVAPRLDADLLVFGEVRINDRLVPREWWAGVRTKHSARRPIVVTINRNYHGGGNTLATVVSITALVAAVAVSAGTLGPLLGPAFAAQAIGANIAAAGIVVAGQLAAAALSAPPSLDAIGQAQGQALGADQTGRAASLSGNALAPGAPLSVVFGTHRVYPNFVSKPLVEIVGKDEVVEAVYALGGPHLLQDIRSGRAALDDMPDVEYETCDGREGSAAITLVTRYGRTDEVNIEVSTFDVDADDTQLLTDQATPANSLPQWHPVVCHDDPDEIWLHLRWPEGLFRNTSPLQIATVPVRFRMRLRGDSTWINLPEIHFINGDTGSFVKAVKIMWGTPPATPTPLFRDCPARAYISVPTQGATPSGIGGWTADAMFDDGAGDDYLSGNNGPAASAVTRTLLYRDRVEFYIDEGTYPKGVYEIEVMRGSPFVETSFTESTYAHTGVIYDLFGYFTSGGDDLAFFPLDEYRQKMFLQRVISVKNEHPVQESGDALIAVWVLGRALEPVSVLTSR